MVYEHIFVKENNKNDLKDRLEKLLQTNFEEHESSYWGTYYISESVENIGSIKIVDNFVGEGWQYEEYKNSPIVIFLNGVKDNDNVLKKILMNEELVDKVLISDVESGKFVREYIYEDGNKILISEDVY